MKVMSYIFQSIILGLFLAFVLSCLFWVGIFANYINYYGIREFFNPFFVNVMDMKVFVILWAFFGFGFGIAYIGVLVRLIYGVCLLLSISFLIPFVGREAGGFLLAKEEMIPVDNKSTRVNVLYENRFYKIYLDPKAESSETLEERKKNLIYYEIPQNN